MKKIWIIYDLIILGLIFGKSITSATSVTNYLLPLLLVPPIYYLVKELLRKSRSLRLSDPAVYASTAPSSTALEGTPLPLDVSDDNRRLFLKLVGSTSLSVFFMAVLGKKSASAAFFGSMPGPGTIAIKDSTGTVIDPSQMQPTDGYEITQVDDASSTAYYGFVHKTGAWYITKEDSSGAYRYAKGSSGFSASWSSRSSLTYDYFDAVF